MSTPFRARNGEHNRLRAAGRWLMRLHEDEMSQQQISDWVRWSENEPKNLEAFEKVKTLLLDIKNLSPARKGEALRRLIPPRAAPAPRYRYALAASLAVLMVATGYWIHREQLRSRPFANSFVTTKAQDRRLTLPDGTAVELGARSQLVVRYTERARHVELLEGEAFFDVESDTRRPFSVDAGAWQLTDIGTAFNVRKTHGRVVVAVAEGIVDIARKPGEGRAAFVRPLRIVAGEEVAVDTSERPLSVAKVDSAAVSSWQQGQLRFKDEPLSAVVANLNRYSNREIVIADPAVGAMQFSGTVLVDNVDGWLTAVCRVFSLEQGSDGAGRVRLVGNAPQAP